MLVPPRTADRKGGGLTLSVVKIVEDGYLEGAVTAESQGLARAIGTLEREGDGREGKSGKDLGEHEASIFPREMVEDYCDALFKNRTPARVRTELYALVSLSVVAPGSVTTCTAAHVLPAIARRGMNPWIEPGTIDPPDSVSQ